jgi:hypothetical protein
MDDSLNFVENLLNGKIPPEIFATLQIPKGDFSDLANTLQFLCIQGKEISAENIALTAINEKIRQITQYMEISDHIELKKMRETPRNRELAD